MQQELFDLLNQAAQAVKTDPLRKGNVIHLPANTKLIATGDLHGHRRNFERIVTYADLGNNPSTHLLLQEIVHGGPQDSMGGCLSFELLFDVYRLKLQFPSQVHIIMGNHDTSVICDSCVMKDGREMTRAMKMALQRQFPECSEDLEAAIKRLLFSQPLAVKCENGIFLSHSLPADRFLDQFDPAILDRDLTFSDFEKPGSVYLLTWGRNHSQQTLDKFSELLNTQIFVLGHQTQSSGYLKASENLLIITSEHNHGCILPIGLSCTYSVDDLVSQIIPLAALA